YQQTFISSVGSNLEKMNFNKKHWLNHLTPVPPIDEQHKITSILFIVDSLIRQTQKIIEQSQKLKKGLMQKLLTKGIGHTRFKKVRFLFSSLMEIPIEWERKTVGELFKLRTGGTPSRTVSEYFQGDIPWVTSTDLNRGIITNTLEKISKDAIQKAHLKIFPKGTFLIATYGLEAAGTTVALDTSSMTSVALAKILFANWLGGAREYAGMAPDLDAMLGACDAALLIGDPALQVDRTRYVTLDLAEEWVARTGKSFVFAFWAIRKQALAGRNGAEIAEVFQKSRDHGLAPKNLEAIAQEWASRLGITVEAIRDYLTQNIHYYLDPPCLEGLELYYRLGVEIGALPRAPGLSFLQGIPD
ncbi:MAG: restriction endonuclease subunit S, partial [Acidobacteriia bacterium]|nr:restriction endonuclease subunit S [Terriglobia bacterium]